MDAMGELRLGWVLFTLMAPVRNGSNSLVLVPVVIANGIRYLFHDLHHGIHGIAPSDDDQS